MRVKIFLWVFTASLLLCIRDAGGPSLGEADVAAPCDRRFLAGQVAGYCTTSGTPSPFCCHYLMLIFNRTRSLTCAKMVLNQVELKAFVYTEAQLLEQYVACSVVAAINSRDAPGYLASDGWATCPRPVPCPAAPPCPQCAEPRELTPQPGQSPPPAPEVPCPRPSPCPPAPPCPQCAEPRELTSQPGQSPPPAPEANWLATWFRLQLEDWGNVALKATFFGLAVIGMVQVIKRLWQELISWNERSPSMPSQTERRGTGAWPSLFSPGSHMPPPSLTLPPEIELSDLSRSLRRP